MPLAPPIVYVVDDDLSVRESLELLIGSAGWRPEIYASAQAFLSRPRDPGPSCLILDVNLPDLNGLELQAHIAADRPGMPVIFITGYGDVPTTVRAMKAGAMEFLTKPFSEETLLGAVQDALDHSQATLGDEAEVSLFRDRYALLSPREREVMAGVVSGRLNKQVGGDLGISEITVKAHRGKVMRKMQARTFVELMAMHAKLDAAPAG